MRLVYAGTPEFAVPALLALLQAGHDIAAVYTQPDRPSGRGRKLTASPVKQAALEHGLEVRQPPSLKDEATQQQLADVKAEVMIVAAYGLILPKAVLAIPPLGCINIHGSLLPRWRGAAPIQRAILAGDKETGITIMQMAAGLDTGPMLLRRAMPLADLNAAQLHDHLMQLGADMIVETLSQLAELEPQEQDEAHSTYAKKLEKSEALLDWQQPAEALWRQVRAFNPWPVSFIQLDEKRNLRVFSAEPRPQSASQAGFVISHDENGILVSCGEGSLLLQQVQLSGRKPMPAAELRHSLNLAGRVLSSQSGAW